MENSIEKEELITGKSVENDFVKFWIEDGILQGFYKKNCILSLKAAKEVVEMRLKFQEGKTYKGLIYVTHVSAATPEAKEYLAKEGYKGIEKAALISTSHFTILIGNLFIKLNKPLSPTKLFSNKQEAINWLNKD